MFWLLLIIMFTIIVGLQFLIGRQDRIIGERKEEVYQTLRYNVLSWNEIVGKDFPLSRELPKRFNEKPEGKKGRNIWGFLIGR